MQVKRPAPNDLIALAGSDPENALGSGESLLREDLHRDDRSTVLRAMALAAREVRTMSLSLDYAAQAVAEAEKPSVRTAAMMTLGGSLFLAGANDEAMEILTRAEETATPHQLGEIRLQEGTLLGRLGQPDRALGCFKDALSTFREFEDDESEAMTLNNRGMVRLYAADLEGAGRDLTKAVELHRAGGRTIMAMASQHNLGMLSMYRGDLVEALARFDESERGLVAARGSASEVQVSRCEALISAGLFTEAAELARRIARDLGRAGLSEDEAEAHLVAAQSALAAGHGEMAVERARSAADLFRRQGRGTWEAQAKNVELAANLADRQVDESSLQRARSIAKVLEREQQAVAAFNARLNAGLIAMEIGRPDEAVRDLAAVSETRSGPLEVRLQSRLADALLHRLGGDRRRASAAVRAGLNLLDQYQAGIGARDMRAGIESHARQLSDLALELALESRRPRRVFQWMERTRARSLRFRPVAPPQDAELAGELVRLRMLSSELRTAIGDQATRLRREERLAQEAIRSHTRTKTSVLGLMEVKDLPREVVDQLAGRSLVEFADVGGDLWRVVVEDARYRLRCLGSSQPILRELESLRFMLRRLARRGGDNQGALEVTSRVDDVLFGAVDVSGTGLVIVPTPAMYAVPWSTFPTLRSRPLMVAPSAEMWLQASRSRIAGQGTVVVAGPDLEFAAAEALAIGKLHGTAAMGPEESKVERVARAIDGAALAHIASHAFFEMENPMFSALRLNDGDLYVYDIERLGQAPGTVVLSACDSGFSEAHAGTELLGLSSALLSMGTRSIIASVGLVPDSQATRELMLAFHRELIDGVEPALALTRAQAARIDDPAGFVAAASFICIGRG